MGVAVGVGVGVDVGAGVGVGPGVFVGVAEGAIVGRAVGWVSGADVAVGSSSPPDEQDTTMANSVIVASKSVSVRI